MDTSTYELLLAAAIRYVSFRPRSEAEMRDFLSKKLHKWNTTAPSLIAKVMDRLKELSYVDDAAFAAWWITQRSQFRPKGERLIDMELLRKGVSREVILSSRTSAGQLPDQLDEADLARKAISKKIASIIKMPLIEQKKKIYSFLLSRGFSTEIITKIIDEIRKKDYNAW